MWGGLTCLKLCSASSFLRAHWLTIYPWLSLQREEILENLHNYYVMRSNLANINHHLSLSISWKKISILHCGMVGRINVHIFQFSLKEKWGFQYGAVHVGFVVNTGPLVRVLPRVCQFSSPIHYPTSTDVKFYQHWPVIASYVQFTSKDQKFRQTWSLISGPAFGWVHWRTDNEFLIIVCALMYNNCKTMYVIS